MSVLLGDKLQYVIKREACSSEIKLYTKMMQINVLENIGVKCASFVSLKQVCQLHYMFLKIISKVSFYINKVT